jgi:hypothetical protein
MNPLAVLIVPLRKKREGDLREVSGKQMVK